MLHVPCTYVYYMLLRCRDLWDRCYVHMSVTLLMGWGGGWDVNVPCTSYITCCYAVEISGIVATSHVVTSKWPFIRDHGTQALDRRWASLKKYTPKELASKNSSNRDLNQKIRDYIYSFVWRCNVAKDARLKELGTLAKTCK